MSPEIARKVSGLQCPKCGTVVTTAPPSMDEITSRIGDLVRNPDDPDHFKALKMASSANAALAGLPPPMSQKEKLDRLIRLMRGAGITLCQISYGKAFPQSTRPVSSSSKVFDEHVDVDRSTLPRTLKQFYRTFPDAKRPGFPPGYPVGRGVEIQQEWIIKASMKIIKDREREQAVKASEELTEKTS